MSIQGGDPSNLDFQAKLALFGGGKTEKANNAADQTSKTDATSSAQHTRPSSQIQASNQPVGKGTTRNLILQQGRFNKVRDMLILLTKHLHPPLYEAEAERVQLRKKLNKSKVNRCQVFKVV